MVAAAFGSENFEPAGIGVRSLLFGFLVFWHPARLLLWGLMDRDASRPKEANE